MAAARGRAVARTTCSLQSAGLRRRKPSAGRSRGALPQRPVAIGRGRNHAPVTITRTLPVLPPPPSGTTPAACTLTASPSIDSEATFGWPNATPSPRAESAEVPDWRYSPTSRTFPPLHPIAQLDVAPHQRYQTFHRGGVSERFKEPVLKTGVGASPPWVRIPPPPPVLEGFSAFAEAKAEQEAEG